MTRLPRLDMIEIFIRNRTMGGWPRAKIRAAIMQRTRWHDIEYEGLSSMDRQRYDAIVRLLAGLQDDVTQK